jgi:catechol 2,3-dioxygenase-like lactoylglutathione lyase family enzyme
MKRHSMAASRMVGLRSDPTHSSGMPMQISGIVPQLRTTDLAASIDFYTTKLGFTLDFRYEDFYAGVRSGNYVVHLKLIDAPDPSIAFVGQEDHFHLYFETGDVAAVADALRRRGVPLARDVHETAWGTRECIIKDNAGHTLYFGERR